jgi:hypothetical protein
MYVTDLSLFVEMGKGNVTVLENKFLLLFNVICKFIYRLSYVCLRY